MLAEAIKNKHTLEGSMVYNQIKAETKQMKQQVKDFLAKKLTDQLDDLAVERIKTTTKAKFIKSKTKTAQGDEIDRKLKEYEEARSKETQLGRHINKPKDYGRVTKAEFS